MHDINDIKKIYYIPDIEFQYCIGRQINELFEEEICGNSTPIYDDFDIDYDLNIDLGELNNKISHFDYDKVSESGGPRPSCRDIKLNKRDKGEINKLIDKVTFQRGEEELSAMISKTSQKDSLFLIKKINDKSITFIKEDIKVTINKELLLRYIELYMNYLEIRYDDNIWIANESYLKEEYRELVQYLLSFIDETKFDNYDSLIKEMNKRRNSIFDIDHVGDLEQALTNRDMEKIKEFAGSFLYLSTNEIDYELLDSFDLSDEDFICSIMEGLQSSDQFKYLLNKIIIEDKEKLFVKIMKLCPQNTRYYFRSDKCESEKYITVYVDNLEGKQEGWSWGEFFYKMLERVDDIVDYVVTTNDIIKMYHRNNIPAASRILKLFSNKLTFIPDKISDVFIELLELNQYDDFVYLYQKCDSIVKEKNEKKFYFDEKIIGATLKDPSNECSKYVIDFIKSNNLTLFHSLVVRNMIKTKYSLEEIKLYYLENNFKTNDFVISLFEPYYYSFDDRVRYILDNYDSNYNVCSKEYLPGVFKKLQDFLHYERVLEEYEWLIKKIKKIDN